MALLDLQGMQFDLQAGPPASVLGSNNSAGASCGSTLSAVGCFPGHGSTLSAACQGL
jgi:hypothetical protein